MEFFFYYSSFLPCLAQTVALMFASGTKEPALLTTCPVDVLENLHLASWCGLLLVYLMFSVPWKCSYRSQQWKSPIICRTFLYSYSFLCVLFVFAQDITEEQNTHKKKLQWFAGWQQPNINDNNGKVYFISKPFGESRLEGNWWLCGKAVPHMCGCHHNRI